MLRKFKGLFVLIIMLALMFTLGANVFAEPITEPPKPTETVANSTDFSQIPWWQMDDRSIAMMIINRQFEYMLAQIQAADRRVDQISKSYEDRLAKEVQRNRDLTSEFEDKIAIKDNEIKALQNQVMEMDRRVALFFSENSIYLYVLISAVGGIILGLIMGAITRIGKGKKQSTVQTSSSNN